MKKIFLFFAVMFSACFGDFCDAMDDIMFITSVKIGATKTFAKVKWGALVVDGRGKLGGHVMSKNRGGSYMRTKVTPSNPQSASQGGVRNSFTSNAQAWRGITDAQRSAWRAAVSNFVGTDIFGDSKTLSGFQLFMRINNYLLLCGEVAISDPPLPTAVPSFLTFSVATAAGAATMSATFTGAIAATEKVILSATAGQSAGKSFVKSEYRNIDILDNADASPCNIKAAYIAKFGSIPAAGQKIYFKMQQVNLATGLPGAVIYATSTVAA